MSFVAADAAGGGTRVIGRYERTTKSCLQPLNHLSPGVFSSGSQKKLRDGDGESNPGLLRDRQGY